MDGQEIRPRGIFYGQFPSPGYLWLFSRPREGQKEPCSFPGYQVLGLLRAPDCCIFWAEDLGIGFRRGR